MKRTAKKKKKSSYSNPIIFIFAVIILSGILSYLWQKETKPKVSSEMATKKVIYPAQYSDKNITANAILSDQRFQNITFSDTDTNRKNLANVIDALGTKDEATTTKTSLEKGTWLWTPIIYLTPEYTSTIISGAAKNGIKNIYLSIDSYLDIFVMPDGPEKDAKQKNFDKMLGDFITVAHKNGMTVDAEGGWRNWAEKGNSYKALVTLAYAIRWNKIHAEKLRGFQYDVEPYLLDRYGRNKEDVLKNFLDLINNSVNTMSPSDLQLSVVIPDFYDGTSTETPAFSYAGKIGFTLSHLLRILDQRPDSKIIIMSYRNFSTGTDGSIEISKNEITEANKYKTKVVIAEETGKVSPSYVTFYDTTRKYYDKQVGLVQKAFAGDKSYGGMATHYINAFLEL